MRTHHLSFVACLLVLAGAAACACAQVPEASEPHTLIQALGRANSRGDLGRAQKLATRLLEARPDEHWKARWLTELGSLSTLSYRLSRDADERARAVAYLQSANQSLRTLMAGSPPAGGKSRAEQLVINLAVLGSIQEGTETEYRRAADSFAEARRVFVDFSLVGTGVLTGYDPESLAQSQMVALILAGEREGAAALLGELDRDGQRWPVSYYASQFARMAHGDKPADYQSCLSDWLSDARDDSYVAFVKFDLARSYFDTKAFRKAERLFLELRDAHRDTLLEAEKGVQPPGSGGYLSSVLYNLGACRFHLGQFEAAIEVLSAFREAYPRDGRFVGAGELIEAARREIRR